MKSPLTFGQTLRAYRLGWRWADQLNCLLRMSRVSSGVLIQLHPAGLVPSASKVKEHVMWWEDPEIINACPPLRSIKKVKKPCNFIVDAKTGALMQGKESEVAA